MNFLSIFHYITFLYIEIKDDKYINGDADLLCSNKNKVYRIFNNCVSEDNVINSRQVIYRLEKEYFYGCRDYLKIKAALLCIDEQIYRFDDYHNLFNSIEPISMIYDGVGIILKPANSITRKHMQVIHSDEQSDSNEEKKLLRKINHVNPQKACYKIGLNNISFYDKNKHFITKTIFVEKKDIEDKLGNEIQKMDIGFLPLVKRANKEKFELVLDYVEENYNIDKSLFTISYKNEDSFIKWYKRSLSIALTKTNDNFIISPEIIMSNQGVRDTPKIINESKSNKSFIYVSGSNWNNHKSQINVFDETGKKLLTQNKYCQYLEHHKGTSIYTYEDLRHDSEFEINILHIKNVGTFAFIVCSDALDDNYLSTILETSEPTDLIMVSFSDSFDIFSNMSYYASRYLMTIFICNACFYNHQAKGRESLMAFVPNVAETGERGFRCIGKSTKGCDECANCSNESLYCKVRSTNLTDRVIFDEDVTYLKNEEKIDDYLNSLNNIIDEL